jgi:hypothetical protein
MSTLTLDLPGSNGSTTYQKLAALSARDGVLHLNYEYLAYRETDSDGSWRVRIRGSQTAGAVFEPAAMEREALKAEDMGSAHFVWGYTFEPSADDPRHIEFRVHVANGAPSEIEMYLRLRKGDGTPADPKSMRFVWPS